jgi:hypothetical protein
VFKLILILFGAAVGAAGTASWLLSEPESPAASPVPTDPASLQARRQDLIARLRESLADGQRVGGETEARLRRELEAYRSGTRPAAS